MKPLPGEKLETDRGWHPKGTFHKSGWSKVKEIEDEASDSGLDLVLSFHFVKKHNFQVSKYNFGEQMMWIIRMRSHLVRKR